MKLVTGVVGNILCGCGHGCDEHGPGVASLQIILLDSGQ